jgi:hypothetical protein
MHWYRRARIVINDPNTRLVAPPIADHPDALAVWEYLDRSVDPSIVGRAFELPLLRGDPDHLEVQGRCGLRELAIVRGEEDGTFVFRLRAAIGKGGGEMDGVQRGHEGRERLCRTLDDRRFNWSRVQVPQQRPNFGFLQLCSRLIEGAFTPKSLDRAVALDA